METKQWEERDNKLTTQPYWEGVYSRAPKMRLLPKSLIVPARDIQKLLRRYIKPQMQVLEIGCAPGKQLAYVSKHLKAKVSGVDYSERGIDFTRQLFKALGLEGDFRCEDIFSTTFPPGAFDFVYSEGVIEHFDDPTEIVRRHVELLKPGGAALITIPNYRKIYGRLQRHFDPENLSIHNLDIMTKSALSKLAPSDLLEDAQVFSTGKLNPWLVSLDKKLPSLLSKVVSHSLNAVGILQPFEIDGLCPSLALKMTRLK